jgi:hypothetical protein
MKQQTYTFEFVELMPKILVDGVLYISIPYATASHRCFCGCGMKVVTPLSPTDWKLAFDGDSVSLHPSIGNWSYPCRSHYVLRGNRVLWAGPMSKAEIRAVRQADGGDKERYYRQKPGDQRPAAAQGPGEQVGRKAGKRGWWRLFD